MKSGGVIRAPALVAKPKQLVTKPTTQLPMSLIERGGFIEHVTHVCHRARVPADNVLIESGGAIEHLYHGRDRARIPAANVLIEIGGL